MQWGGHRQFALNLVFLKMMGDEPNCAQIMRNSNLMVIRRLTDFRPHPKNFCQCWIAINSRDDPGCKTKHLGKFWLLKPQTPTKYDGKLLVWSVSKTVIFDAVPYSSNVYLGK